MKNLITSLSLIFVTALFAQVPPDEYRLEGSGSSYGTGSGSYPVEKYGDGPGYLTSDPGPESGHDYGRSQPSYSGMGTATFYGENKKMGLKSSDGTILLQPLYDAIRFTDVGATLKVGNKIGLATRAGTIILPVEYDSVYTDKYNYGASIKARKKSKWGSFDENGKPLLPVEFYKIIYSDAVSKFSLVQKKKGAAYEAYFGDKKFGKPLQRAIVYSNGVVATAGGKQGFLKNGKEILPFEYDSIVTGASRFSPKQVVMVRLQPLTNLIFIKNGKFGLANLSGGVFLQPEYDKITYMADKKLYILIKDKKYGVHLGESGFYTTTDYDMVSPEGRYVIFTKDKKQALINSMGTWLIPIEEGYDKITAKGKGFVLVKDKKTGLADGNGVVTIPALYDAIEDISYTTGNYYRAQLNGKWGFIDGTNKLVIPAEYDVIFAIEDFVVGTKNKQFYIFNAKGQQIGEPYDKIHHSEAQRSKLIYTTKNGLQGVLSYMAGGVLYAPQFKQINYLYDQDLLISSLNNGKSCLAVKDSNNKWGVFEEYKPEMAIPLEYDGIYQKGHAMAQIYFVAKKDKKFGVIDRSNRVVVPFQYDSINFNGALLKAEKSQVVAVKGKKFGVINFSNEVVVPFEYKEVAKISPADLYKARKKETWVLIDGTGKVLNAGPFDEIAQFEGDNALTFYKGQMRVINSKGVFTTQPAAMQPHNGYKTFDELKLALVAAFDSPDDALLKTFADKAAPSAQIFYFLKRNIFNGEPLYPNVAFIKQRYYDDLLHYKKGIKTSQYTAYDKEAITGVMDHTFQDNGFVTVKRTTNQDYGSRFMEAILRNAIKINGYWISTYFMTRNFERQ